MKKAVVFLLVLVMVFSLSLTAFADAYTPNDGIWYPSVGPKKGLDGDTVALEVYNEKDELIDTIPVEKVLKYSIRQAGSLSSKDAGKFMKYYEAARAVTDKYVVYFFWLEVVDYVYPDDFCYIKYPFSCPGENVTFSVNGKPMEVVHEDGENYFAKMTETGAIMICCDRIV